MDVHTLQDEIERLLRRLTVEEIKAIAQHLQVEGAEGMESQRELLRSVQGCFDGVEADGDREQMLRSLPIPEGHQEQYQTLLVPPPMEQQVEVQAQIDGLPNPLGDGTAMGGLVGGGVPPVVAVTAAPPGAGVGGNNAVPVMNNVVPRPLGPGYAAFPRPAFAGQAGGPNNGIAAVGGAPQQHNGLPNPSIPGVTGQAAVPDFSGGHASPQGYFPGYGYPIMNPYMMNYPPRMPTPHARYPQPDSHEIKPSFIPMVQKEFRLHGSISDDVGKSISFNDLRKQVDDGKRKGYTEADLMAGLRRGITTGSLKTYIDACIGLSLADALEFLQSHLKEQTPSELLNQLSKLKQKTGQSANGFLLDAMKLRQMLIVGTGNGGVTYDSRMAHSVFLHTLRTGLRNDRIRMHMMPYLDEAKQHGDNVLTRELNRAVAEEEERQSKITSEEPEKKKISTNVNEVMEVPEKIDNNVLATILSQMQTTQKQLQANQDQMLAVQSQVNELVKLTGQLQTNGGGRAPFRKMCEPCTSTNKPLCRHCWKCGGDGHQSKNCPSSN